MCMGRGECPVCKVPNLVLPLSLPQRPGETPLGPALTGSGRKCVLSSGPRGTSVEEKGTFLAQLPVSLPPKARCPSSIEATAETSPVPWGLPS